MIWSMVWAIAITICLVLIGFLFIAAIDWAFNKDDLGTWLYREYERMSGQDKDEDDD